MSFAFLGPDPVESQVSAVLSRLADGEPPSAIEVAHVDVKEEPGRRGERGAIQPGRPENESAAQYLAGEMACMANTVGGGALILGVADDGSRIGTEIDPDWLRHRIYEITERRLTVSIRPVDLSGCRVLVLSTHESIEPVRHNGRISWRVDDHCVEVDASSWYNGRLARAGFDWSAQPSGHTAADVSAVAVEQARRYLRSAAADVPDGMFDAPVPDLLRRLNVIGADGRLTNAGSLLFVGTPGDGIDYIRRDFPAGDSLNRVRGRGPLLEQVADVERASQAFNRVVHLPDGFSHGQFRALPERAIREAIVNGVVHRDWLTPQPTVVEHVGDILTVMSPGGFVGGVTPSNIITHPSAPRYRSLAESMSALGLAEREGIGIDRMVRDMLATGRGEPEITEMPGPYVRVGLIGGEPDPEIVAFLAAVEPGSIGSDVDALLILDRLMAHRWVDARTAAPLLQRPLGEALASIDRLAKATINGAPILDAINGVPSDQAPAYRLSDAAQACLKQRTEALFAPASRDRVILSWALARGRVSSTEVADLVGVSSVYANTLLTNLEESGAIEPGRENKRGRGFFYVPAVNS